MGHTRDDAAARRGSRADDGVELFDDSSGGPCQARPSAFLALGIEDAGAAADIHAAVHFLFPQPAHMPCSECGASVARDEADEHVCDSERLLDYRLFQLRGEIEGFDGEVAAYLETPLGRFEAWYAKRHRHGQA